MEFGGGTGEQVAVFRDLGFAGRYVIQDLPPMLLLQQYALRYSGVPAYVDPAPAAARTVRSPAPPPTHRVRRATETRGGDTSFGSGRDQTVLRRE